MARSIKKVVVLGAGVMGSSIAGLLAGAGLTVDLMDIVPKGGDKPLPNNILADTAKKNLPKLRGVYDKASLDRIRTGNFTDNLDRLTDADWIIEVIVERMDVKKEFYKSIEKYLPPHGIVSSNTSGLSINEMAKTMSPELQKRFLGIHFFNPPRYMKLVELIPSAFTAPSVLTNMESFIRTRLGKGTVITQDTPNFIANRIGCFSTSKTMELATKYALNFAEADAYSGVSVGRSPSATFRTTDIVGLDTTKLIIDEMAIAVGPVEGKHFTLPTVANQLVELGHFGDKTGSGFFKRVRKPERKTLIWDADQKDYVDYKLALADWYQALGRGATPADVVWAAKTAGTPSGDFVWNIVKETFLYAAARAEDITDDFRKIDLAMQWGYNWVMGPFSLFDAMDGKKVLEAYKAEGAEIPAWVETKLGSGGGKLYDETAFASLLPSLITTKTKTNKLIHSTDELQLFDIGDGVGLVAFSSKGNTISTQMALDMIPLLDLANDTFDALVIGNNGKNFSAGANLAAMYASAIAGKNDELRKDIKAFQAMSMAIKYFGKPIVAAPFNMTLGGGFEVCMASTAILAQLETNMGLVEVGVGLVPGGGGIKEMAIRVAEVTANGQLGDDYATLKRNWECIALGKTSTSGLDAIEIGYLRPTDRINMDALTQIKEAKDLALSLQIGYRPPVSGLYPVKGTTGYAMLCAQIDYLFEGGWASEYDAYLARQVANAICGGDVPEGTLLTEQQLLDLELETFVHLTAQEKTQQRIDHMLKTGKRLAN